MADKKISPEHISKPGRPNGIDQRVYDAVLRLKENAGNRVIAVFDFQGNLKDACLDVKQCSVE